MDYVLLGGWLAGWMVCSVLWVRYSKTVYQQQHDAQSIKPWHRPHYYTQWTLAIISLAVWWPVFLMWLVWMRFKLPPTGGSRWSRG